MPLRVLFLDVDGVITVADGSGRLDEAKMRRLQALVQQTGCQVCISSNWRLFRELKARLVTALQQHGGIRVIGSTPDHGERTHGGAVRPEEIIAFLQAWRGEPIETWCAVDDRPLHTESGGKFLEGHFVQVNERLGLTDRAVERISAVLAPNAEPEDPEVAGATAAALASSSAERPGAKTPDQERLSPDSVLGVLQPPSSTKGPVPKPLAGVAPSPPPGLTSPDKLAPISPPPPKPAAERAGPPTRMVTAAAEGKPDLSTPRTGGFPSRRAQSAAMQAHLLSVRGGGAPRQPFQPASRRAPQQRPQQRPQQYNGTRNNDFFMQRLLRAENNEEPRPDSASPQASPQPKARPRASEQHISHLLGGRRATGGRPTRSAAPDLPHSSPARPTFDWLSTS